MTRPAWLPDWLGATVALVGAGPSALKVPLAAVRGRARVIVVNESWRLAPWADLLYAADARWWVSARGAPDFAGLKVAGEERAAGDFADVRAVKIRRDRMRLSLEPGSLTWGGNSGFQALNLAVQCGARRILLIGFDMTLEHGEHWHGRHGAGMNNPTPVLFERWRRALERIAPELERLGVTVLNCSPGSALTAFPAAELEEALEEVAA